MYRALPAEEIDKPASSLLTAGCTLAELLAWLRLVI